MLLLLTTAALASEGPCSSAWWSAPTPRDTRPDYIERHRELTWQVSSGRGASPAYRDAWARMDVDLWLRDHGQEGLLLDPWEQERIRDLSFSAAALAGQVLVDEVVARSDGLLGLQLAVRTFTSPSLTLGGGQARVNSQPPQLYRSQLQATLAEPGLRPPPRKRLTFGATGNLVDDDLDPEGDLAWAWTTYVSAQRVGLDFVRVGVDLVQVGLGEPGLQTPVAWRMSLRHGVHPRVALVSDARSVDASFEPRWLRSGVELKVVEDRRVWLRVTSTYGWETPRHQEELRADLRLTWAPRWRSPASELDGPWSQPGPTWTPPPVGPLGVGQCPAEAPTIVEILSPGPSAG